MKRKPRSIILLDELPDSFVFPSPSPKKRRVIVTEKLQPYLPIALSDTSGALVVDRWKSAWKYRDHHVRVTFSKNFQIKEYTVFENSKMAAIALGVSSYFNVHRAIINDGEIKGCFLEYTITKSKGGDHNCKVHYKH